MLFPFTLYFRYFFITEPEVLILYSDCYTFHPESDRFATSEADIGNDSRLITVTIVLSLFLILMDSLPILVIAI